MRKLPVLLLAALLATPAPGQDSLRFEDCLDEGHPLRSEKLRKLTPTGKMDLALVPESSGIVASRRHEGMLWVHSDSGDAARITAIRSNGTAIAPGWIGDGGDYKGILLPDAVNIDWEDIATDDSGNLYIGAFGNNSNARRDLGIYMLREPNPEHILQTRTMGILRYRYPDQLEFPPETKRFDTEALAWHDGILYIMTKDHTTCTSTLYTVPAFMPPPAEEFVAKRIFTREQIGKVTAMDISPDGMKMAVLTYYTIRMFERLEGSKDFLSGQERWLPIEAGQCEALCFLDAETLLLTNEAGDIFEVPVSNLKPAPRYPVTGRDVPIPTPQPEE